MLLSFLLADTHDPMDPLIFSSREHLTSTVALKPILNSPFGSFENTRWYVCLKSAELKLSPMTMLPPDFISSSPVWSSAQLYRSMA